MAPVDSAREALPLWLASVPDPFTPAQGRAAADAALADADAVIGNVKAQFHGTVPPSPWPKSAALEKAIDDVEIVRDAMKALDEHTDDGRIKLSWSKTSGKFGPALVRVGTALYTELDRLEGAARNSDSVEALTKLLPSPSQLLKGVPPLLLFAVGLWALSEGRKLRRLIEGT